VPLRDLVVILAAAVAVVLVLRRIQLPAIAGFIVAGAALGPAGFGWVHDIEEVRHLAEIGVVLLLFTVGLEFPLRELRRLRRVLGVGGGLQVGLTMCATAVIAAAWGAAAPKALFLGFLVALSSTAIVLKGLTERGEIDAPHGRLIVGMLLFQDLCVVPMILLVPALAGRGGDAASVVRVLATAAVAVVVALTLARWVVPRALRYVAASRGRDLFVLTVVLVAAAITWMTSVAGFSLALGAFMAGMVLADSEYGHQALADSLALRDLFTSLFFVSIGMLLDFRTGFDQPGMVAAVVAVVLLGKAAIAAFAGLVLRFPARVALLAGFGVAQIGEFSFVLGRQGADLGLLTADELRVFFAASVITMFIAPLALRFGPGLAAGASRLGGLGRLDSATAGELAVPAGQPDPQVVVLGFGVGGELLAEVLREAGVPFIALDLNGERVRQARRQGTPLYFGDVTSREIQERAGVAKAAQVVVVLNDPRATLHAVRVAREVGPKAVIIARARYVGETPALLAAGADEVVAQELEASFTIIERVSREARLPRLDRAGSHDRHAAGARQTSPAGGARLPAGLEAESAVVPEGAWIAGRSLAAADLRRRTGATLVALTRDSDTAVHPSADDVLKAGDVLSLVGNDEQLAAARSLIASGPVDNDDVRAVVTDVGSRR
jgi:monovalent cation:H+ antiporter-2, CPA2 family